MTFAFKDSFSEGDGVMVREYQIPVSFTIPKPLADELEDISTEVLQSLLSDTQKKLDMMSLCLAMLTVIHMRLRSEGNERKSKKVGGKITELMEHVEDLCAYALRESSKISAHI